MDELIKCMQECELNDKTKQKLIKDINCIIDQIAFYINIEFPVDLKFFDSIEEKSIYNLTNSFSKEIIKKGICEKSQDVLISYLIKMNEPISLFFDNVIVNHNDSDIRINRLNLLKNLHNCISKFSIFELIEG